jgi:Flp pilus assembly protein TadB
VTAAKQRGRLGHERPGAVLRGPPLSISCACGQQKSVPYGATWNCDRCSRTWDTSQIPREEYDAIRRLTLRFRLLPVVLGLLVATVALFFVLTGNGSSVFVLLPLSLIVWFTYLRNAHRRRFRAAIADRKNWRLGSH